MLDIWERQRDAETGELEPNLWWFRFDTHYRPMGPERSLLGAVNIRHKQAQKSIVSIVPRAWFDNCKKWNWKQRAEAWDEHERQKRLVIEQEEREQMIRRHVQIGLGLQTIGGRRLKQLESNLQELSPSEARLYLKEGVGVERQARGLPEYLLAIAQMSDEELFNRRDELLAGRPAGTGSAGSNDGTAGTGNPTSKEDDTG